MKNTDEINNIVELIINNYNHTMRLNAVANDDEAIKLIRALYYDVDNISEVDLVITLFKLCETISVYKIGRDINCTYTLARLCYKISKKLIVDYDNTDAVYAMFLMAKERLFELYLLDKNYYRHVAAAFYSEMEVDSFAYKFGFYDAREIYENLAMTSVSTKVDVDHDLVDYAIESNFRAYVSDMSFIVAMRDYSFKQEIIQNTLKGNAKGGIYECVAADILNKKGYNLFFYRNETTKKELDFIIQKEGKVIPIEIKSGNTKARSLNSIIDKKEDIPLGYKFVDGNVGLENKVLTLPLYMLMFV